MTDRDIQSGEATEGGAPVPEDVPVPTNPNNLAEAQADPRHSPGTDPHEQAGGGQHGG